ncbi:hypothetical protein [Campylobacter sp. RM16190]|nr:hypothetical protein [Campylobacter sp. RM16190]
MSNVISFEIGTKIFYEEVEYYIKAYTNFDEVILKKSTNPFDQRLVKVNELIRDPRNIKRLDKTLSQIKDEEFDLVLKKYKIIEPLLKLENRTAKDVEK